jgi:transposase-like protein
MINETYSIVGTNQNVAAHPSPYQDFTQSFTPKKLKDLFKWCEYLFYNSPQIYAALRKFGEYPITEITYETSNSLLRHQHKDLLEKTLRARELLIKATLDKYVYGNAFLSMYQPFMRFLQCPHCKSMTNIQTLSYTFNIQQLKFSYTCPSCNKKGRVGKEGVIDKKLMAPKMVNFIRWDPKQMDIEHNPITDESVYYYTIPRDVIGRVNNGHKSLIDSLPWGFLEAVKENKKFKFAKGVVFHLKMGGPAGINPQWGLPPLLSVMSLFHYTAILRKANTAIALDHLVPFRIIHPAQASGVGDPISQINLSKWKDNMAANMAAWRKDPLHVMFAPVPVGVIQVGGQGRALLTLGEIQEAEKSIISALGIPIEFIYGGLTGSGMEATLRLIENQLETHINDLLDLLQWVDDKCATFLGWEKVEVGMAKFRMTDDMNTKQLLYNLWQLGVQSNNRIISDQTMTEILSLDLPTEQKKIKQETLDRTRDQMAIQKDVTDIQNSMAENVRMDLQAQQNPAGYNQQQIISQADQVVQSLMGMEHGERKSRLDQLQSEDMVMYAVVVQRLEQARKQQNQEAGKQARGGQ